ncbi:MAG: EamA family transporter [Syntrophobacteraceae bacterium CG2_30_61_12]|nr:MAG: EamA family transporter [Syntrophobacteraceae bacterium CG2_30_61_12]
MRSEVGVMVERRVVQADWLLMLTAIIWGGAFVAQRMGMDHVGPLTFNGVRFALGALALLPLSLRRDPAAGAGDAAAAAGMPRLVLWGGALAGLVLFIAATLQQVGLVYTTAGKAGFITGLYVIIVPILGALLGQKMGWSAWLGALVATFGLYLLSVTETFSLEPGDPWVLLGAFFWAVHMMVLAWLAPRMNGVKLACAQFWVCAGLSLAVAGYREPITISGLKGALMPILYGGLLSVGVAYTLQVVAQRHAPPIHAAIILSLESVFAALAGWVILGEVLSLRGITGCLLMLAGMLIVQLWPRPALEQATAADAR